jgi:8-oxo-dGTP diphosphatase
MGALGESRVGTLHVAVAVVVDASGEVLIAKRPPGVPFGELWEFPGGKVQPCETVVEALRREIHEEVGIEVRSCRPFIHVEYNQARDHVLLDCFKVERWDGDPMGREGQEIVWANPATLDPALFPAPNRAIITALRLPAIYLITPPPPIDPRGFLATLEACLEAGIRLVQFRAKGLTAPLYRKLAREVLRACERNDARLLLNDGLLEVQALGAHGVHLPARSLLELSERPLEGSHWVAASCHNAAEVAHAQAIGVDFIVVSPVRETATHPSAQPLGWERFMDLATRAQQPTYALGGLGPRDLVTAWEHGAQGLAMISAVWGAPDPAQVVGSLFCNPCVDGS